MMLLLYFFLVRRCRFTVFGAGAAIDSPCSLPQFTRQLSVHGSSGQSGSVEVHRREGNRSVPKEANSYLITAVCLSASFSLNHFDESINNVEDSCL